MAPQNTLLKYVRNQVHGNKILWVLVRREKKAMYFLRLFGRQPIQINGHHCTNMNLALEGIGAIKEQLSLKAGRSVNLPVCISSFYVSGYITAAGSWRCMIAGVSG